REEIRTFIALPLEERTKIVRYLCENRERIALDIDELLFYSIISGTKGITKILKEYGAKISEARTKELTDTGRGFQWTEFSYMIDYFDDKEYMEKIKLLYDEMGCKTLRYSDAIYYGNYNMNRDPKQKRMYDPKIFRFVIDHFDRKKMNQKQFMIGAINENSVACLKICAEIGWLSMPRKRDEMIKYASETDKRECTAFLLDFKNRTADLKAEQERAEKRIMRQINADPNSATEMKKIWGFEKREDGGVIITGYKGKRTEVIVPEKIGSMIVREIGDQAFSTEKPRLRTEQIGLRQNITKITLPETVEAIGNRAFSGCTHLKDINIPEGVRKIG
ncbi:MAG: leucine-rich repeat domain-containing protein, partial [Ruminiclostridium sp.]|nr:leucine-rich repeat domain-containing protein [Ruminiclostridium sp.]